MHKAQAPMLSVRNLEAWYGESHILHGVGIDVREGEVVTLLGRNGAGKTTTIKSIMGMVNKRSGSVSYEGQEIISWPSNKIARAGIATEGLAPVIIQQIAVTIKRLKEAGFTILLVEQNFRFAATVADRFYVMESGRVIDEIENTNLESNLTKLNEYLGV